MATINVYEQYFEAEMKYSGVERRGALVMLIADSEAGNLRYEAAVSFFPHRDDEDYAVSYDAYFSKVLFEGSGRRSKKKDKLYTDEIRKHIDELAEKENGKIFWDKPLREAKFG